MLRQHGQSHADWKGKVKAVLTGSGPMDALVPRKVSPAGWNAYHCCHHHWVIMSDHSFSFVDNPLSKKYTK